MPGIKKRTLMGAGGDGGTRCRNPRGVVQDGNGRQRNRARARSCNETEPAHAPVGMRGRCRVAARVTRRRASKPVQGGGAERRAAKPNPRTLMGACAGCASYGVLQRGGADARGVARRRCRASTGGRSVARRRHGALLGGSTGRRQVVAAAQGVANALSGSAGRRWLRRRQAARGVRRRSRWRGAAAQGVARRSWWRGSSPGGRGIARRRGASTGGRGSAERRHGASPGVSGGAGRRQAVVVARVVARRSRRHQAATRASPAVAAVRGVDRWSRRRASPGVAAARGVARRRHGASPGGGGGAGRRQVVAAARRRSRQRGASPGAWGVARRRRGAQKISEKTQYASQN
ncbi:hypothetical protein GGX14DRAFT_409129 [Mycena pura]|uniref:Uncharacterized protein n=1 Tax=Mycena pura TaxID=153505 RepID=A0AAD6UNZ1_9AGAR|nr:hypothetical protein GGX14DRAFT_409129 [Mycena pura]